MVVVRGTDGLTHIAFSASNRDPDSIDCAIAAAHWYSVDLGTAVPGGTVRADLWASTATGEIFVLNDKQDRMPVQNLWCGFAGRSWATRSLIALERRAGPQSARITLQCRGQSGRLQCDVWPATAE